MTTTILNDVTGAPLMIQRREAFLTLSREEIFRPPCAILGVEETKTLIETLQKYIKEIEADAA